LVVFPPRMLNNKRMEPTSNILSEVILIFSLLRITQTNAYPISAGLDLK
jgi:hypothetical protein